MKSTALIKLSSALSVVVVASVAPSQTLRDIIRERMEQKQAEQRVHAATQLNPRPSTVCENGWNLGYRVESFSHGMHAAIWYPTGNEESRFEYPAGSVSVLASATPVATCERYPLIVFSHGFGACGTQSLFLTEALARAGYIVVAPDHRDSSLCKVDQGRTGGAFGRGEEPFAQPGKWTDATYKDRADDIRRVLDELGNDPLFVNRIDWSRIGAAGHSLGGYTVMGLVGGWEAWRDGRIKAALLLSPYAHPFVTKGTVDSIHVPVMYQSGTRDIGIDPVLKKPGGAYDLSHPPKYFEEISDAGHAAWSNFTCFSYASVPQCDNESHTAKMINEYAIAFFDRYLKGKNEPILGQSNGELAEYRHSDR